MAICGQVATRTPVQVRTHSQKYFLKLKRQVRAGAAAIGIARPYNRVLLSSCPAATPWCE